MERRENDNASGIIRAYFTRHASGTAKEIYNRTGRTLSHSAICDALDALKSEGYLEMRVAPATRYHRACYVFFKINKKESLIQRFFSFFKSLFNYRSHQ